MATSVERVFALKDLGPFVGNKSRATIYLWIKAGQFPEPIRVGANSAVWLESALVKWQAERVAMGIGVNKTLTPATKARTALHAKRRKEREAQEAA